MCIVFLKVLNMQYSITNYGHRVVHYIPMIYLLFNWKFVPSDSFHPALGSHQSVVDPKNEIARTPASQNEFVHSGITEEL